MNYVDLTSENEEEDERKPAAVDHQRNLDEEFVEETESEEETTVQQCVNPRLSSVLRLTWTGPPKAWKRPECHVRIKSMKQYSKHFSDPNAKSIEEVREGIKKKLGTITIPYYGRETPLVAEFEFYRRLPDTHFRSGVRDVDHLKNLDSSVNTHDIMVPDIDNLVKFALEAMQTVVYKDDCQVVMHSAVKLLDVEEPYDGRTLVRIRPCKHEDLPMPDNPSSRPPIQVQSNRRLVIMGYDDNPEYIDNAIWLNRSGKRKHMDTDNDEGSLEHVI
jgi:Holliday junction resolvase RusA-like endonuclease